MSYSYRARKKAIRRAKTEFASELKRDQLPAHRMPKNPYPPKPLGSLSDFLN